MGRTKIHGGSRVHFYADKKTIASMDWLSEHFYAGNRSRAIRDIISKAVELRMRAGTPRKNARARKPATR